MSGPESKTVSAARSMFAATTLSGTASPSKVASAPSERSRMRCSGAGEFRCVLVLKRRHSWIRSESP